MIKNVVFETHGICQHTRFNGSLSVEQWQKLYNLHAFELHSFIELLHLKMSKKMCIYGVFHGIKNNI